MILAINDLTNQAKKVLLPLAFWSILPLLFPLVSEARAEVAFRNNQLIQIHSFPDSVAHVYGVTVGGTFEELIRKSSLVPIFPTANDVLQNATEDLKFEQHRRFQ